MFKAMYRITDSQIVGGADWIDTEHYNIDAKVDRPSTVDQLHEMFRTLLADRFQLQFHRETRLASAYVMTGVKEPSSSSAKAMNNSMLQSSRTARGAWSARGFPCRILPGFCRNSWMRRS
jgi:uncharacterized protein (TIGR03435 family)